MVQSTNVYTIFDLFVIELSLGLTHADTSSGGMRMSCKLCKPLLHRDKLLSIVVIISLSLISHLSISHNTRERMNDSPIHHKIQGRAQDRGASLIKIWQLRLLRSTDLCGLGQSEGGAMVINIMTLSDNILLEIFDTYRICYSDFCDCLAWKWDRLVHVRRRWHQIIFASPLRLHLHLHCTFRTRARRRSTPRARY